MTKLARCIRLSGAFQRMGTLATRDVVRILDVDRQTAVRDVKSLIDAGVPIEIVGDGRMRRYVLDDGFRRSGVLLSQGEAFALHLCRRMLLFVEGTDLTEWMDGLQSKLGTMTPRLTAERQDRFARRLVFLSEPYRAYRDLNGNLNEILSALLDDRELSVDYRARGGVRTWEDVQPLALVVYRRALYLMARFRDNPTVKRLAIDRIESAGRGGYFDYPRDFDPAGVFVGTFGVFDDGRPPAQIVLKFDARVADLVRGRVWHESAQLEQHADLTVTLRLWVSGPELLRQVLEFGGAVEVVHPPWLREQVREELAEALARYPRGPNATE